MGFLIPEILQGLYIQKLIHSRVVRILLFILCVLLKNTLFSYNMKKFLFCFNDFSALNWHGLHKSVQRPYDLFECSSYY